MTRALLFALATAAVLQALAAHFGLVGVALVRRRTHWFAPLAWLVAAALAACSFVANGALLPGILLGLSLGIAVTLAGSALARVRPDARFLASDPGGAFTVTRPEGNGGVVFIEPAGDACAGVVVLVHGTGNDRLYGLWYLIERLTGARYAVLTAHLPGHGRDGADLFDLASCRARVDALGALARGKNRGPVVALGQSLGGALVLDAVVRGADFDAFIAVSSPDTGELGASMARELGALAHAAIYRTLRYGTVAEVLPAAGSFRRSEFPVRFEGAGSYVDAVGGAVRELDLRTRLRSVPPTGARVLVVHGEDDGVVPVAHARALAEALGPRGEGRFVRGVHHLDPLFDARLVGSILEWIGRA